MFIIIPLIAIIILLLIMFARFSSAYYIGFSNYGMNRTKANNILNSIPVNLTIGIKSIIFSDSDCVSNYGGTCNWASYSYLGIWNRIIIGHYNSPEDCLEWLLWHEIKHHEQRTSGMIEEGLNGFNESLEEEANNYANEKVVYYECW